MTEQGVTHLQDTGLPTETCCLGITSLTFPKQAGLSAVSALMDELILSSWSSLHTELNHNPIKRCRGEQSSYSFGFASQSLHPNPEEMGKRSFPAHFNGQPWASWFVGPQSSNRPELIFVLFLRCQKADRTTECFKAITTHSVHSHFLQQQLSNQ